MHIGVFSDVFTKRSSKRPLVVAKSLFGVGFGVGMGTVWGLLEVVLRAFLLTG